MRSLFLWFWAMGDTAFNLMVSPWFYYFSMPTVKSAMITFLLNCLMSKTNWSDTHELVVKDLFRTRVASLTAALWSMCCKLNSLDMISTRDTLAALLCLRYLDYVSFFSLTTRGYHTSERPSEKSQLISFAWFLHLFTGLHRGTFVMFRPSKRTCRFLTTSSIKNLTRTRGETVHER